MSAAVELNAIERQVLLALQGCGDEYSLSFLGITRRTGLARDWVAAACRSLARKGLAHFTRGLFNEDGETAGSGYGCTYEGLAWRETEATGDRHAIPVEDRFAFRPELMADPREDAVGERQANGRQRLAFAANLQQPCAPDQLALVWRIDLMVALGDLSFRTVQAESFRHRLERAGAAAEPGWRAIPIKPTREMWAAAGDAVVALQARDVGHHDKISEAVWQAMLAAAPTSVEPPQPTAEDR